MDKHFLKQDLKQAYKEESCAFELSIQFQNLLVKDDFYILEEKLIDILKSVHELKRMNENKKVQDRFEKLVGNLQADGVNATLIRRMIVNEDR